jgi:hypothetical protein
VLWFTLGYAQYQLDDYETAVTSLRQAIAQSTIVPLPAETLEQTRFLIADATDRHAVSTGPRSHDLIEHSIEAWQEFVDSCRTTGCDQAKLDRAEQRIRTLRQAPPG